jgi:hypothetical protein
LEIVKVYFVTKSEVTVNRNTVNNKLVFIRSPDSVLLVICAFRTIEVHHVSLRILYYFTGSHGLRMFRWVQLHVSKARICYELTDFPKLRMDETVFYVGFDVLTAMVNEDVYPLGYNAV